MKDITPILGKTEAGDLTAAEELLPLVYEALRELESQHPEKARLVKLRFFAGCSLQEAAGYLGVSRATAQCNWAYARAWLYGPLDRDEDSTGTASGTNFPDSLSLREHECTWSTH